MLKPVSMSRVRLFILERDERAVLRYLGGAGMVQLVRSVPGPETAPLAARDRSKARLRIDRLTSRLESVRRALELRIDETRLETERWSLEQAEAKVQAVEEESAPLVKRRQQLQGRLAELIELNEQISDCREVALPLDSPHEAAFLHFVTGTLSAKNFETIEFGSNVAVVPLAKRNGQQLLVAMTTVQGRPALDQVLQQAGFEPEELPTLPGLTSAALFKQNHQEQKEILEELEELNGKIKAIADGVSLAWTEMNESTMLEKCFLDAEQHFSCTENAVLITGWVAAENAAELERTVREMTRGGCVIEITAAEEITDAEVPVLLRHPRWLRPFALLVTAYGLPRYGEWEPTVFVAVSYLLMFGMMFGDAGHGLVLALAGLGLCLFCRDVVVAQAGLLLTFAGCSSIVSGAIYGSYFGIPQLNQYALWHDPLSGTPTSLMMSAVGVGIVMISLGLILNTINHLRHREFAAALLDKFGATGVIFYWGALVLVAKAASIRAHGLLVPMICLFLVVPVIGWMLKEPIELWWVRRKGLVVEGGIFGLAIESFVNAFEALLSYFANTVSFVRLAAYAMSHAALLMAAFMIAKELRHVSVGGQFLSLAAVIIGNLVAIVLEGIVASVQALRLEYYEFFGKFFSGGGQPFSPFRLYSIPVAGTPP